MFHYDEDGELQTTTDAEEALRYHALTVLRASSYPLAPRVAAGLGSEVGRTDETEAKRNLQNRVQRALNEAGLAGNDFNIRIEQIETTEDMIAAVGIGSSDT